MMDWLLSMMPSLIIGGILLWLMIVSIYAMSAHRRIRRLSDETADVFETAFERLNEINKRLTDAGHPPGRLTPQPRDVWSPRPDPTRR